MKNIKIHFIYISLLFCCVSVVAFISHVSSHKQQAKLIWGDFMSNSNVLISLQESKVANYDVERLLLEKIHYDANMLGNLLIEDFDYLDPVLLEGVKNVYETTPFFNVDFLNKTKDQLCSDEETRGLCFMDNLFAGDK